MLRKSSSTNLLKSFFRTHAQGSLPTHYGYYLSQSWHVFFCSDLAFLFELAWAVSGPITKFVSWVHFTNKEVFDDFQDATAITNRHLRTRFLVNVVWLSKTNRIWDYATSVLYVCKLEMSLSVKITKSDLVQHLKKPSSN